MANVIGRVEELTRQERKALRAQTRALRKQAQGLRLCGAKTRQGRPCWNGTSKWQVPDAWRREHRAEDGRGPAESARGVEALSRKPPT
jgi:hypothetical protein